jgi:hypothetical protein
MGSFPKWASTTEHVSIFPGHQTLYFVSQKKKKKNKTLYSISTFFLFLIGLFFFWLVIFFAVGG